MKDCGTIRLVGIAMAIAWGWSALAVSSALAQGAGPAPVRVVDVREIDVASEVNLVGDVEPARRSLVAAKEAGAVVEFPRREGEFVKQGELLARLETTVLELELQAAEATLSARKQEHLELKNGARAEAVAAAKAKMRSSEAMARMAKQKLERTRKLNQQNSTSREELEQSLAMSENTEETVLQHKAELLELENGARPERIAQAEALVGAQQAMVNKLRSQIDRHRVLAPFSGYIVKENTQVGEWLIQGARVVEMVDIQEVDIRAMAPSRYSAQIRVGLDSRIDTESSTSPILIGSIRQIVPDVDLKSRLFPVKIRIANSFVNQEPVLRPGMLTRISLPVGEKKKGLFVPKDTLVLGQSAPMLYVVRPMTATDGKKADAEPGFTVSPVFVRLGVTHASMVEVRGEIKAGDRVVIQGNERLRPGAPIRILTES